MAIINFLSAKQPLTKTLDNQGIEVASYPMVKNFSSHKYNCNNIAEFRDAMVYHANMGHCLLKGPLSRDIQDEPRAGLTSSLDPTQFICLDYDGIKVTSDLDSLFEQIIPGFSDISRVVQYSAKAGFSQTNNHRAHIFIWLEYPLPPAVLKHWLLSLNLSIPILRQQISLSANGMALRFPLDITTCQNDKLIYIAPPIITNGKDPLANNRILFLQRSEQTYAPVIPNNAAQIEDEKKQLVHDLQVASGIKPRAAKYKTVNGEDILTNALPAIITGIKKDRGFVYLNLNGGDSWAYYFPEDNPSLVRNFKGEPAMYLKDLAPDLYKEYTNPLNAPNTLQNIQPVVFREIYSDSYYNALLDISNNKVLLCTKTASKDRLGDFMLQYGATPPDFIEDWTLDFDPQSMVAFNIPQKIINLFSPTHYMKSSAVATQVPPVIEKLIRHLTVDQPTYDHFMNWLAFCFQRRLPAQTAWLFHGRTGTGKGTLFHRVITPLWGRDYVHAGTLKNFDEKFNGFVENKLMIFIDETQVDDSKNTSTIMNTLKNLITEPTIAVRNMHAIARNKPNFASYIFTSNELAALCLASDDRRFNIAPRQESAIEFTIQELEQIDKELNQFADFLRGYQIDEPKVRAPLHNDARQEIINMSKTSIELIFQAIREGDLDFFQEFMASNETVFDTTLIRAKSIIDTWLEDAKLKQETKMSTKDLYDVYTALMGNSTTLAKFGRICARNHLKSRPVRINDTITKGFTTNFKPPMS